MAWQKGRSRLRDWPSGRVAGVFSWQTDYTRRRKHTSTATYPQPEENPYQSGSIIGVQEGVANHTKGNRTTIVIAVTSLGNLRTFARRSKKAKRHKNTGQSASPGYRVANEQALNGRKRVATQTRRALVGHAEQSSEVSLVVSKPHKFAANQSRPPSRIEISLIQTSLCFANKMLLMPFAFSS
jgi:hypothetical protein